VDWLHFFHFSPSDLRGLVSRRTVILAVMALFIFQGVGVFYKGLALQLVRMRPAPAVEVKAQAAAGSARGLAAAGGSSFLPFFGFFSFGGLGGFGAFGVLPLLLAI